jgi:hypothetical protein
LAVINGEVVEDVAQVASNIDPHQQQEELDKTLKYIEAMLDGGAETTGISCRLVAVCSR